MKRSISLRWPILLGLCIVAALMATSFWISETSADEPLLRQRYLSFSEADDFADDLAQYSPDESIGPFSIRSYPLESFINLGTEDWMALVQDDASLSEISIPGTHDTAADNGGSFCETQDWHLEDQFRAGIRYLDIRCRRNGRIFTIHHGSCYLNISFDDVLESVSFFLSAHPEEMIIMRIKEEYTPTSDSRTFDYIWNSYMKTWGDLFVDKLDEIPSLGSVRGRVVVVSDEQAVRCLAPSCRGWGLPWSSSSLIDVQDDFRIGIGGLSLKNKAEKVTSYIDRALEQSERKMTFNHLSGTAVPLKPYPREVAEFTNKAAYDYIGPEVERGPIGVIIMDYPGEALIGRILLTNFA